MNSRSVRYLSVFIIMISKGVIVLLIVMGCDGCDVGFFCFIFEISYFFVFFNVIVLYFIKIYKGINFRLCGILL